LLACAEGAAALVLTTPWPQYRELQIADLARLMTGRVLIDPYRLLYGGLAAAAGFECHALGMPPLGPGEPGSQRCESMEMIVRLCLRAWSSWVRVDLSAMRSRAGWTEPLLAAGPVEGTNQAVREGRGKTRSRVDR